MYACTNILVWVNWFLFLLLNFISTWRKVNQKILILRLWKLFNVILSIEKNNSATTMFPDLYNILVYDSTFHLIPLILTIFTPRHSKILKQSSNFFSHFFLTHNPTKGDDLYYYYFYTFFSSVFFSIFFSYSSNFVNYISYVIKKV